MSKYEFSLKQEVLMEKGAAVLGDLFRYKHNNGISDKSDPVSVMYSLMWDAREDILDAKSEDDLAKIENTFDIGNSFIAGIGA